MCCFIRQPALQQYPCVKARYTMANDSCWHRAGLVIQHLGRVPKFGERVRIDGFEFEVQRADPRQVHILLMRRIAPSNASATE